MDQTYTERNDASRDRLQAFARSLDETTLQRQLNDDWTIAAALAHVAFWDQLCLARWMAAEAGGALDDVSDEIAELVNQASLPGWRALPAQTAAALLIRATDDVDAAIAALPAALVRRAQSEGNDYMLDRSDHRDEHAAEIERALGEA
ncbi:MAG TPA: DinB family protein [Thermomicrobiales bacterium]|nr:DinB family protein [Thermomicrobiales bacterium]